MLPHRLLTSLSLTAVGAMMACSQPEQPKTAANLPPAGADGQYEVDFPESEPANTRLLRMTVSEDIDLRCPAHDPFFEFDVAEPGPEATQSLRALADCLQSPALEGQDILLVGHADERGSERYNRQLSMQRAAQAAQVLVAQGVDPSRLNLVWAGEQNTRGGEEGWSHGYDRRVDVIILDQVRKPMVSGVEPYMTSSYLEQ